ncbi:MexE family multidrug efflux RND transporter periplasmic adaptor subunit [Algimonas arctica]|uniref:MexE family multidrug efflux RND transporter periplasmic adaptor subunit n=1 Tax=Algimonas arctica TaxID=1479486 RepID=A0A8J3G3F0_9PROT|nr:efflux RND transporter periplasmic adaptor subunit [Algimonas arctica]GHB02072.1 MexE family multidrug efflux RND transporter periplasmic adaptor subunit [Algimonas arctica]
MAVETVTVREVKVPNIIELPGRVEPVRQAEVRARVNGIVQKRLYEEGTDVKEGQPLFSIDPRELRASLAQVKASLQRAEATAANARAIVDRYRPLVAEQAISGQEYDSAIAASREADANIAQIEAQIEAANLQLGYTVVRAPISGRARRAQVTEGALVSASGATLMTRIEQLDPVYVTVAQASSDVLKVRRAIADGTIDLDENGKTKVQLYFGDGTPYSESGYVDFLDFSVNETTGTVNLRAEFPNPDQILLPGEFVHAEFFVGTRLDGISVPQRAVQVSATGASVFVIDGQGKVAVKPVELGPMAGDHWIINSGLAVGEKVITSNLQKLRPGVSVKDNAAVAGQTSGGSDMKPGQ